MSTPFMQLYVADYLGDTRHLTTEQHGAYMLLLMTMWRAGGVLPNDTAKLARIAGLTVARWTKIADDVMAFFEECEGGITQKRLASELAIAEEKSQKRSECGKAGARAKALKNKDAPQAKAEAGLKHSSEPEPDTDTNVSVARDARPRSQADFDQFWSAYPAKVGRKAAEKAWRNAKDRPPLAEVLAALDRYRRTKPADRDWCNPATWLNQGRWMDGEAPTTANDAPAAASRFAETGGPDALRQAVVDRQGEPYARSYLDPCRWDASTRRLSAANAYALDRLTRDFGDLAASWKFAIVADPAPSPAVTGAAA